MLTCEEKLDIENMFIRSLSCALIGQAVEDLRNTKTYKSEYDNAYAAENRETSRIFLNSTAFIQICEALNLPADKIKTKAYEPRD
jgi:hypothetical protein